MGEAGDADLVVVGGGILGLATAYALLRRAPGIRLLLLEKEERLAAHQTGHNSGVIHSGLYYTPGSLKARLARAGGEAMYRFCEEQELPAHRTGKVVVATDPSEVGRLEALAERGRANGVRLRRITPAELRDREPHVRAVDALLVTDTGITDFGAVAARLAELVQQAGGELRRGVRVLSIVPRRGEAVVLTSTGAITARRVVSCAGLWSDALIRASGKLPPARIVPFRGEYYEVTSPRRELVRTLVYPVPDPAFPFLGVHLTRMVDGSLHAGPNAVLALAREGYRRAAVSASHMRELAGDTGLRMLARRYWRTGALEVARSLLKPLFVRSVQRLVPELTGADLHPAEAGVRAQAMRPNGELVDDFLIVADDRCVHVVNAPSPAATASLLIGEEIATRALALPA